MYFPPPDSCSKLGAGVGGVGGVGGTVWGGIGCGAVSVGGGGGVCGGMSCCAIRLPANSRVPAARALNNGLRDFIIDTPCQNDRWGRAVPRTPSGGCAVLPNSASR